MIELTLRNSAVAERLVMFVKCVGPTPRSARAVVEIGICDLHFQAVLLTLR